MREQANRRRITLPRLSHPRTPYDKVRSEALHSPTSFFPAAAKCARDAALRLVLLLSIAACGGEEYVNSTSACPPDGALRTELHGGFEATLAWQGEHLECTGMPRPRGAGARLRFAGNAVIDGEERRLAFIIALPGLEPGDTPPELPASVTLIEEDAGRFFSTRDAEVCWADIERQDALVDDPDASRYAIGGLLYCVEPLAELHGSGSIMLGDLRFSGWLNWEPPK